MNSSVRACTTSALERVEGSLRRSMTRTPTPLRASSIAVVMPVGPAPATRMSVMFGSLVWCNALKTALPDEGGEPDEGVGRFGSVILGSSRVRGAPFDKMTA